MNDKMKRMSLPARVQAALEYLDYCHWAQHSCDSSVPARGLSVAETCVQTAALDVLRTYFQGEMDFGDAPPVRPRASEDDDGAGEAVPVRV